VELAGSDGEHVILTVERPAVVQTVEPGQFRLLPLVLHETRGGSPVTSSISGCPSWALGAVTHSVTRSLGGNRVGVRGVVGVLMRSAAGDPEM
jgi:hypothetical protein